MQSSNDSLDNPKCPMVPYPFRTPMIASWVGRRVCVVTCRQASAHRRRLARRLFHPPPPPPSCWVVGPGRPSGSLLRGCECAPSGRPYPFWLHGCMMCVLPKRRDRVGSGCGVMRSWRRRVDGSAGLMAERVLLRGWACGPCGCMCSWGDAEVTGL